MADTASQTCPMRKIPLEVLLRITHHLSTPDLGSLRLTSRSLEQSLYTTFVNEFFTRKQFMITEDSLQALIDISKSRLAQHLRYVHFGLDRFPEGIQRPLSDDEKERKFRERYANNFTLWNTGHHRDMMAEAFRNLPQLEDVIIRDFNSRRRSRDGPTAEWHSYGFMTAFNETGVPLNQGMTGIWNSGFPYQYCSQVFSAVLYALAAAEANIKGIEIMSRNANHLRDFAFNIPKFMEPKVVPILQGLEKLHLCIDLAWRSPPVGLPMNPGQNRPSPDLFIRNFLLHTTNLKNLRINEHRSNSAGLANLIDWMVDSDGGGPTVSMPNLEELSLGTMNIDAPRLLKLIKKFAPSLKSVELWKVTMIRHLPPNAPTPTPRESFWADFMKKLTDIPGLELRHFKAGMLQQHWIEKPVPAHVTFKGSGPTRQYTGPDWKHFIAETRPLVEVHWPYEVVTDSEHASDDEDDVEEGDLLITGEEDLGSGDDADE
ncbi:F-box domain-containing protein [Pochonia chlamydosporia 170]|uniref:F-box domain-containing protein n=1 Tax=Pochonia chlamydosporia 170 TaxID=1380566 RepID=A0A179FHJ0_METCM|nr:F-box domain-containing protein [Pochonia chlamydosporia 170]OAQ65004.2 F-box domain-containing protein [Pochonia chlamydosporia 170]